MILRALSSLWTSGAPEMADHLWQSTLVVVLATVLTFALRKNQARVRHRVWLAASMKFLLPFSLLITLGGHFAKPRVNTSAQVVVYSAVEQVSQPFAVYEDPTVYHASKLQPSVSRFHLIPPIMVAVWLCGIALVLLRWTRSWVRISRIVRKAVPIIEGPEVGALRTLESQLGIRKPIQLVLSQDWMEPGIFGIFRPVLMWPEGISVHLDERHLRAVLAHEICHVRRRDNLAAVLPMLSEAIFWFHPLVWWMGGKLEEERERACDEEVMLLFGEPEVYAESILKVCKFCSESPLACVSGITGADLKKRIVQIMKGRVTYKLGFGLRVLLLAVGLLIAVAPILMGQAKAAQRMMLAAVKAVPMPLHASSSLPAQRPANNSASVPDAASQAELDDAATGPAFEVAAIRPSGQDDSRRWFGIGVDASGKFTASKMPLSGLVGFAYIHGYEDAQVKGGPAWVESDSFDINAKVDDAYMKGWDKLSNKERTERVRPMIRRLLAERFHLKLRTEMQVTPVYALVQAKGGTRMKEVPAPPPVEGDPIEAMNRQRKEHPGEPLAGTFMCGGDGCKGKAMKMSSAIGQIAGNSRADRIVVDQTGLKGYYDFSFNVPNNADERSDEAMAEIEYDLGLKFEPRKIPIKTYIIESAEKPSLDGAGLDSTPKPSSIGSARLIEAKFTQVDSSSAAKQGGSSGQKSADALPAFDAVSIRPYEAPAPGPGGFNYGRSLSCRYSTDRILCNMTALELIEDAFQLKKMEVAAPATLDDRSKNIFTLTATMPPGTDKEAARRMLQHVLVDRFQLKFHYEPREIPVYALIPDKNGVKLQPADSPEELEKQKITINPSGGTQAIRASGMIGPGRFLSTYSPIESLAHDMSFQFDLPVVDKSGQTGNYKLDIKWEPTEDPQFRGRPLSDPEFLEALKEQAGLRLEKQRIQVKVLVVDHIDNAPSEN